MAAERVNLRDAALRAQGERLVRSEVLSTRVGEVWVACLEPVVGRVLGFYSFRAVHQALGLKLPRKEIEALLDPAREACAALVGDGLLEEVRLTDEAARALLREGLPAPPPLIEGLTEDDAATPGSGAYTYRARTVEEIGVRLGTPVLSEVEVERLAYAPMNGATWPTRFKRLAREASRAIHDQVAAAVLEGWSTDRLAREVAGEVGGNEYRARLIARTELQRVANQAYDRAIGAFGDLVSGHELQAAWENTCLECGVLDGRVYSRDESRPSLPIHPRCACTYVPVTRTWRELGIPIDECELPGRVLAGYRRVAPGVHWRTWIREQPADYQRRILGPTRMKLLKQGKIKMDALRAPGGGIRPLKVLKKLA